MFDFHARDKAELHVHLDGSVRLQTLWELMTALPETERPFHSLQALQQTFLQTQHESLIDYLRPFEWTLTVMQTEPAIERIAYELAIDASTEGITKLEVRGCPMLCQQKGLSLETVIEATLAGLHRGAREAQIQVGWIMSALRHHPSDESVALARLASHYRNHGVVGFDLAGPEEGYLSHIHSEALTIAKDAGLGITLHAGEAAGPESIWDALEQGADRLGHACSLLEDVKLIDFVAKNEVILECCPSSNIQTRAVKNLRQHPLKRFLELGLKATINTDNRLMSQTTLQKEFQLAESGIGLSDQQLISACDNALSASFL